ncbi:TrkA C-terminal domain-containing protein [Micromonospora sp. NPDC126480]|uniref:cation:proton antiporter regulatory subunit n=1 Tax=Micromonospora sp. NPDC126480 TaxID=3155312 RepID=UPI003321A5DB
MQVEKTSLPGIGVSQRFTTAGGQRAGLIAYPDGRRDLVIYHPDDPDTAAHTLSLERTEAQLLADLLAAVVTVQHVADLERQLPGITVVRIPIGPGTPADGRAWREVDLGGRALSLLAVIRGDDTIAAPGGDFVLAAGDEAVVAGTEPATSAAADVLASC